MIRTFLITSLAAAAALVSACSGNGGNSDGNNNQGKDGGNTGVDAGASCTFGDATYPINCTYDPGFTATYPDTPNTVGVTYSAETLGVDGLPFFPNLPTDPVFVDGWSVQIFETIVVVGNIRLDALATGSSDWWDVGNNVPIGPPPLSPPPYSTPAVMRPGPYVVDGHRVSGFLGKDGIEAASGLFYLPTMDNGQPFDTGTLYAFSYDTVQATYPATNVNLDPSQLADYQLMVNNHWDKLLRGVATHTQNLPAGQGGGTPTAGTYPDPAIEAKFEAMPQTVYFAIGYDDHTHMYNCVNPDNAVDGSPTCSSDPIHCLAARGIQTNSDGQYIAQITLHQDHIFWDKLEFEGEPLRFDPIAAYAPANTTLQNPFWLNNLTQQKLATTFSDGTPLPDRGPCMQGPPGYTFTSDQTAPPAIGTCPAGGCTGCQLGNQVIMNTNGASIPSTSYPDFQVFSVQSQTHLNAQGICYIIGQHSIDPFFVPNVQPYNP
jgi:hypothetical protein